MAYKTVYARIVPINGVVNEKFSVSVTNGATVDGQKTWTSGAMNFAVTPTRDGPITITFKNDTLNQVIGQRTLGAETAVTDLIIETAVFKTDTYNSANYELMWGVNAWDYFVSRKGRVPNVGENVHFVLTANKSIIAPSLSVGALQFDDRWNSIGLVTVENRGIILGRGGNHLGHYSNGGPAIVNLSTNNIKVENHNIIAGGGGGGASFSGTWNNVDGGYGAPFGGTTTDLSFTYAQPARIGGAGYSGPGGGWGQPGKHNSDNDYRNWSNPGKILSGPGSVNNIGSGITLGLQ